MSRIVRQSKYRHVFGTVAKKENCYDDLRPAPTAWDTDFVTASPLHLAVIWDAGGGGAIAPIPWGPNNVVKNGKVDPKLPLITGHKGAVLDIEFSPFHDSLLASVSEDGTGKIWGIPEGGLTANMTDPLQTLTGHKRKVGTIRFNPIADNIVATSSGDFSVKIWDVEKGTANLSIEAQHTDLIAAAVWNETGNLIATSCKDKKLRLIDPRAQNVIGTSDAHQGIKAFKAIWLRDKILTVGFSKQSEREFMLWDPKDISKPLTRQSLDSASGSVMSFFDPDTNMLFMAGKGDGNIRYYEVVDEDPYLHYVSEFKSSSPQRGMGMLPKRAVNVSECEIVRLLKLGNKVLEPIAFNVPRKSEVFQDDIYPDAISGEYTLTSSEWFAGGNGVQKRMSLAPGFTYKAKQSDVQFEKKEEKVLSEKELRDELDKLNNRVSYLEAELVKKDAKIKELETKLG